MITTRPLIRAVATGEEARLHTQFAGNLETADERVSNWHVEIGVGTAPAALQQRIAWAGAKPSRPTRRLPVRCCASIAEWLPNTPDQVKRSKRVSQIGAISIAPRTDSVGQQLCRVMFRMLAIHIWRSHENQNCFRRFQ